MKKLLFLAVLGCASFFTFWDWEKTPVVDRMGPFLVRQEFYPQNQSVRYDSVELMPVGPFQEENQEDRLMVPSGSSVCGILEQVLKELSSRGMDFSHFPRTEIVIRASAGFNKRTADASIHSGSVNIYAVPGNYWNLSTMYFAVMHELGHRVQFELVTGEDFAEYRRQRGIPEDWSDSAVIWSKDPHEVFAEDFRTIFTPRQVVREDGENTYNIKVYSNMTAMGDIPEASKDWFANMIIDKLKHPRRSHFTKMVPLALKSAISFHLPHPRQFPRILNHLPDILP